ncbi:hypothetical protein [uncultured Fibrobacter sp.]|uniref:hypothetical protein n=1 Tax=uncultured Fibrobacter sp. TaxID=261512 RepID=UPI001B0722BA|nr:hypothetical protein [uncultured Fibrobacter sp.]MBO7103953.1 hypothetical protein [Fibrobacter sp.]
MSKLNRSLLKNRFKAGQMPCEEDFIDLIDSMVNVEEEGIEKTRETGLKISQITDSGKLMSFYENSTEGQPLWHAEVRMDTNGNQSAFHLSTPSIDPASSVLSLVGSLPDSDKESFGVGIGTREPECELDVHGIVASSGRLGKENEKFKVPTDGKWHDITEEMTGCQAFEIMAGAGGQEDEGRFALTHAIALNVFHGHTKIRKTQSYYGGRGSRIDIRWASGSDKYKFKLQLRVHCAYKDGSFVRYRLTKLWYDNFMETTLD